MRAVRAWVDELAGHGITTGALFRAVDRYNNIGGQAKFAGLEALRLTGKSVNDIVHRRALLARLPDAAGYAGHSLRSGAATSAYLPVLPSPRSRRMAAGRRRRLSCSATSAPSTSRHNPMKGICL